MGLFSTGSLFIYLYDTHECTGRFSKSALEWCKDIARHQAERQRPLHLPGQNTTNEQGTYDPEAIKKFHYNVAEAQLELHRQNMEWCIGTIAKARHRHVDDVEPEFDGETGRDLGLNTDPKSPV